MEPIMLLAHILGGAGQPRQLVAKAGAVTMRFMESVGLMLIGAGGMV